MSGTNAKTIFSELIASKQKKAVEASPLIPTPKTELSHFKRIVENSKIALSNLSIYSSFVRKTWVYRILFLSIACLFFFLALAIHPKSISWSASFLFGSLISIKVLIIAGCIAIGSIAALIASSLHASKELVQSKINKAYRTLWKIHRERRLKKKIHWFTDCKEKLHSKSVLHHLYHDVCDKIDLAGKETVVLMDAIQKQGKMTTEYKERLIEQTLDELDGNLLFLLNSFRSSWIE